jgi:hypothetical protein
MCQPEHGVPGCIQTVSGCIDGAVESHEVEHALTLVSGDLAYITVCRVRCVEFFPWKLPAGWYALHVAQGDLDETLRCKVVDTRLTVPANLPANCVIAVIRLASPKPRRDFGGDPWALGQWCQAVEDVMLLKNCIRADSQGLRRLWILSEPVRDQVRAGLQGVRQAVVPTSLPACCANAVGKRFGRPLGQQLGAPSCKKARVLWFPHDSFPPEPPPHIDRLKRLYPHSRDDDIYMDEKLHTYYVFGQPYSLSVSGWWKMYFGEFDASGISEGIVRRQMDTPGFRWILSEPVRDQVRAGLQGVRQAVAPTSLPACCANAVGKRFGRPLGQQLGAPSCKKARVLRFPHDSFPPKPPPHIDRLKRLYPHSRDADIYMDEKLHTYYVFGQPYSLSVSGWWKMYFGEFDASGISEVIVRRQMDTPGFRMTSGKVADGILAVSVYNFAQRIRIFERRSHEEYLEALRSVAIDAVADYVSRGVCCPFSAERIVEQGRLCLTDSQKPDGPSCYYLVLRYTAALGPVGQAADIVRTWDLNGKLQSLKGTYLHKKIELFINAMVLPMERDGTLHVPVEVLLQEQVPAYEYSAKAVLRHIAWAQDAELWDHPLAQCFFESEMEGESLEFCKFRSWLSTKSRWSPYRVEMSIYNEDHKVAGQIDSLWTNLDNGILVMVDWKRSRELLTHDENELRRQSFGKKGSSCCSDLFDTAWSHYFVQQNLYSYLLATKYQLNVTDLRLVQCHPHVCGSLFNEAPLEADVQLAKAMANLMHT